MKLWKILFLVGVAFVVVPAYRLHGQVWPDMNLYIHAMEWMAHPLNPRVPAGNFGHLVSSRYFWDFYLPMLEGLAMLITSAWLRKTEPPVRHVLYTEMGDADGIDQT